LKKFLAFFPEISLCVCADTQHTHCRSKIRGMLPVLMTLNDPLLYLSLCVTKLTKIRKNLKNIIIIIIVMG